MGPIALFDKSFLQSLSIDESVWFDNFFLSNVCPLFYVETLADLDKAVKEGRTPEKEVQIIAEKFPAMHGAPCLHHATMALHELLGDSIPMTGQIPLAEGRLVKIDGKSGVVYDESPEAAAFSRWQEGKFLQVERSFAKSWRETISSLDLRGVSETFKVLGISGTSCKNIEEAKLIAEEFVNADDKRFERMMLPLYFLGVPTEYHLPIIQRWTSEGCPPLSIFAPYAAYVSKVEIFFQIALAASIISAERPSNRIDIAYLFYLPFCMVFISSDKLHKKCAPLFLREDQEFIHGVELKNDLNKIDSYYKTFPDDKKALGIMSFACYPPVHEEFLVSHLWDRHLRPWRERTETSTPMHPEISTLLIEQLEKERKAPTLQPEEVDFDTR
ncbi:MAG: hypothetical protein Q7K45_04990, partial [Nanoarchaeota archaeon]|nr:hypothetical protein [Nanoarchaeota archaeon]